MTQMLPPEPRDAVQSEVDVFHAIRTGLDDSWTAIHSLGMAHDPIKPWTEIDFVLIGPEGVFCIEVKGGVEISRHGTKWVYRDQQGRTITRNEGPFEQVGSGTAALRNYLLDQDASLSRLIVGYGVATPFVDFTATGPDIVPELVYDADDVDRPFSEYMRAVSTYWQERLGKGRTRPPANEDRRRLVQLLAGDFQLTRSLVGRIQDVDRALIRLTRQQQKILADIDSERVLVRGGAGTGKTLLALETAVRAAKEGRRTMLTCFSRRLGGWLAQQTDDVEGLTVASLHKYMYDVIEQTGRLEMLPPSDEDHLFKVEYPRLAMEAMLDLGLTSATDHLVVDEAQDLLAPGYLDVFDQMLDGGLRGGRWTMFFDPNQDIFDQLGGSGIRRITEMRTAQFPLTVNCRNTRQIAYTANMLARLEPDPTVETDGPDVETIWYRDAEDQRRKVGRAIGRVLADGVDPAQITVLSALRLENSLMRNGLETVPYRLDDRDPTPSDAIAYSTVAAFKGLESDVVVLVDLLRLDSPEDRYLLYVAATRARAQLVVALPEDARGAYNDAARLFAGKLRGAQEEPT